MNRAATAQSDRPAGCARFAPLLVGTMLVAASVLTAPPPAAAQLSPGPLSEPHAKLEGSGNCLECHSSGRGVDADRCLSCHEPLAERVAAGRGLHAGEEYADCKTCHIEHHGREFDLVWWGERGRDAFDHDSAGFSLQGRHAELGCRDCHRAELNASASALRARGKDLGRTFLGLETTCLSCHRDEHRGQFAADACLSCHTQTTWLPASGFDHETAQFVLTGRHRQVACEECHRTVEEPSGDDESFVRFRGLPFARCTDCHRDEHGGRFGLDCASCHSTADWLRVNESRFDHDLTRYPLAGSHRRVECEACHRAGQPRRGLAFGTCSDCHRDEHAGQLAGRADAGRCESCHTVEGFVPAVYPRQEHDLVFALEGAHRRLECNQCHRREPARELARQGAIADAAASGRGEILRLRMPASSCVDCHRDPHGGSTARAAAGGCETCHGQELWTTVAFDHSVTAFDLEGPHAKPTCRECHAPDEPPTSTELDFGGLGGECAACHTDPHRGQFAAPDGRVECLRCHLGDRWKPAQRFDHARDARFPLEGAHGRVECAACHVEVRDDVGAWVRYSPLGRSCMDCHGGRG